mmetsp:Transcript_44559/g.135806  ORF Transcript_44559/g.135806 Transcript_44559/m.135806 type:complete len:83 (-) Transcript_44559:4-252(-)
MQSRSTPDERQLHITSCLMVQDAAAAHFDVAGVGKRASFNRRYLIQWKEKPSEHRHSFNALLPRNSARSKQYGTAIAPRLPR